MMSKLFTFVLFASVVTNAYADVNYVCNGDLIESFQGTAVSNGAQEFLTKEVVSLTVSSKIATITGPTNMQVPQQLRTKRNSELNYNFAICESTAQQIVFNNYDCNEENQYFIVDNKKIVYDTFEIYEGMFNKVSKILRVETRIKTVNPKTTRFYKATYQCKVAE